MWNIERKDQQVPEIKQVHNPRKAKIPHASKLRNLFLHTKDTVCSQQLAIHSHVMLVARNLQEIW